MLKSYRDLEVWKSSMELVVLIYKISRSLPKEERYGLTSQMQRAAVSIPANIAEGYGRQHRKEYVNYLPIANGSLQELETHLIIALRLEYVTREDLKSVWASSQVVGKLLSKLRSSLADSKT